jgi:predicted nuclease with TOPRIM domain
VNRFRLVGSKEVGEHLMDNNFNILEAKVIEAVALIKELRAENGRLSERCDELAAQKTDLEDAGHRLKHELDEAHHSVGKVEVFELKRMEIEDKVGDLLQKLEAMG